MKKVAVIGAGHVGGTTAMRIAEGNLASVVLVDIVETLAKAKAFDIEDARYSLGVDSRIAATSDFERIIDADVVVVTAGLARKPGMTREDLLAKNAIIVGDVSRAVANFARDAVVIVVTNPLDPITYLVFKKTGFNRERVFGMGVSLDSSRFANLIAKRLLIGTEHIRSLVIGSHGETMVPLPRLTTVRERPLTELLPPQDVAELVLATKQRGAEIVSLYGSGSAYYGPSAAVFELVETILTGWTKEIPVSAVLDGEYGLRGLAIGVPARISPHGVERIVEVDLTPEEEKAFEESVRSVKDSISYLDL